ncbi:MAG: hypothetical protein ACXVH3_34830 [Solirubrobacteraceae bacterium]
MLFSLPLAEIVAWALFIALPIPGFTGTPEPVESIAVVCKAAERFGIVLTLALAKRAPHPSVGSVRQNRHIALVLRLLLPRASSIVGVWLLLG